MSRLGEHSKPGCRRFLATWGVTIAMFAVVAVFIAVAG